MHLGFLGFEYKVSGWVHCCCCSGATAEEDHVNQGKQKSLQILILQSFKKQNKNKMSGKMSIPIVFFPFPLFEWPFLCTVLLFTFVFFHSFASWSSCVFFLKIHFVTLFRFFICFSSIFKVNLLNFWKITCCFHYFSYSILVWTHKNITLCYLMFVWERFS